MQSVVTLKNGFQLMLEFHTCFKEWCCWPGLSLLPFPWQLAPCHVCNPASAASRGTQQELIRFQTSLGLVSSHLKSPAWPTVWWHQCLWWHKIRGTGEEEDEQNIYPSCPAGRCNFKLHPNPPTLAVKFVHIVSLTIHAVCAEKHIYPTEEMSTSHHGLFESLRD